MTHGVQDVFRKFGTAAEVRREAAASRAAGEVAAREQSFYVPRVIDAQPDAGRIDFERIPDARRLSDFRTFSAGASQAFDAAAAALVAIHSNLELPERRESDALSAIAPDARRTFLHGDFTIDNVLAPAAGSGVVIVDWSPARWLDDDFTYGPSLWDVCWMLLSIFMLHPLAPYVNFRARAAAHFERCYRTHAEAAGIAVSPRAIAEYGLGVAELASRLIDARLNRSGPLMRIGVARYRRFCRGYIEG